MSQWIDPFTGVVYQFGEDWQARVRKHLAGSLATHLRNTDSRQAGDGVARFWQEYYEWVFPLRFGLSVDEKGFFFSQDLFEGDGPFDLEGRAEKLRQGFLDQANLPPILANERDEYELISDHLLETALLVNLLLRCRDVDKEDSDLFHQVRLGALLQGLAKEASLRGFLEEHFPRALETALFFCEEGPPPEGSTDQVQNVLKAVREQAAFPEDEKLFVVVGAAQRIKQFVFETPGLNEIRGASTLLNELTAQFAQDVGEELGPEIVLRTAASTIEFIAPSDSDSQGNSWDKRYRHLIYSCTGTAFVAAAVRACSASELVQEFNTAMQQVRKAVEEDRYRAELPVVEPLPFEERCSLCQFRPAEGWYNSPEGEAELICRPCLTKRDWGVQGRSAQVRDILEPLGLGDHPERLGVMKAERREDSVASKLEELIPSGVRRRLIATIYGDGNNFGAVVPSLKSIGMGLQWTNRVEAVTRAAAAVALAYATQKTAERRGWSPGAEPRLEKLPFQVLVIGGDDLSLLTAGQTGLWFCERFLKLTDLEFQRGTGAAEVKKLIRFSLGALFADENAPVRRTVDFAELELLKWAKRAFRSKPDEGNVAFLLAMTAEQIPTDLREYRQRMFLRSQRTDRLSLTLRPFTAGELSFLIQKGELLAEGHGGPLHRLVEAFLQTSPAEAILHYLYQLSREERRAKGGQGLFDVLNPKGVQPSWESAFNLPHLPAWSVPDRRLFGEVENGDRERILFSPLWDLMEVVKVLD